MNVSELDLDNHKLIFISRNSSSFKENENGETLTIGRQGDIIIAANDMTVSRKHFTITRDGDSFIIKDISTNGSFMGSAKSANPTYNNKN